MLKRSHLSGLVGALLAITGTAAIAAPPYQYRNPAPGLAPAQTQAPPPVVLSSVGDGISKAGACVTGAATGCATWGPLSHAVTLSNAQLSARLANPVGTSSSVALASVSKTSGKWYWELTYNSASIGSAPVLGLAAPSVKTTLNWPAYAQSLWVDYTGSTLCGITWGTYSSQAAKWALAKGDVLGLALDMDARSVSWYRNGDLIGVMCSNLPSAVVPFSGYGNSTANWVQIDANFGQAEFKYPVPAGYNAGLW